MTIDILVFLLSVIVFWLIIIFIIDRRQFRVHHDIIDKQFNEQSITIENLHDFFCKQNEKFSKDLLLEKENAEKETEGIKISIENLYEITLREFTEHTNLIVTTKSELKDSQKGIEVSLREYSKDLVAKSSSDLNGKISSIFAIINQLVAENKELKKKIEFFTEIESDSKQLNTTEKNADRESIIQKALIELSKEINILKPDKNGIDTSGSEIPTESFTKEAEDNDLPLPDSLVRTVNREEFNSDTGTLDEEQKKAFLLMEYSNENIFVTGKAGTGKSLLLEIFGRFPHKKIIKLAPTGIAALNIGGATLHSTFGYYNLENLNLDDIAQSTIRLKPEKKLVLQNTELIIIDEISMVRADIFDKIDIILRMVNNNDSLFGGKQIIIFGDLFQLPPIAKPQERNYLIDRYGGIHFFHSKAYVNGNFRFIELTTNHRQKDDYQFFDVLNRIRNGKTLDTDIDLLNSRFVANRDVLRRVVTLFPKKAQAEKVNRDELEKIDAREYTYLAKIQLNKRSNQTPSLDNIFPISNNLKLKRGALVMLTANDIDKRWVNGTLAIINSLEEDKVEISLDGRNYIVYPQDFSEKEIIYKNGRLEYEDVLVVNQYPIILAYAITIHKSQGMTYKKVACNLENCFETGQAYVALSRCSSLDGLFMLNKVTMSIARVDNDVKKFYLNQTNSQIT